MIHSVKILCYCLEDIGKSRTRALLKIHKTRKVFSSPLWKDNTIQKSGSRMVDGL